MNKPIIILLAIVVLTLLAVKAYGYANIPAGFCDSQRFDGQSYESFIDSAPIPAHYKCAWKSSLKKGQESLCEEVTIKTC